MNKKIIITLSTLALISSSFTASFAATEEYSKYEYIQQMKMNNFEFKQLTDKLEDETNDYKLAIRVSKGMSDLTFKEIDDNYDTSESRNKLARAKEYDPLKEGHEYFDKSVEYIKSENTLEINAEKLYYTYLIATQNATNKKENFEFTKSKLETKKLERELGKISEIDFMKFQKAYNDSYIAHLSAENTLSTARSDFNKSILNPINTDLSLQVLDIPLLSYSIEDIDVLRNTIQDKSYQKISLEQQKKILDLDRLLKGRYAGFGNTKIELTQMEDQSEELAHKLNDIILELDYQLLTNYNNTIISENTFKSSELDFQIQENDFKINLIKHNNGMISDHEYIEAKQSYDDAWNKYQKSKLDFYVTAKEFENFKYLNTLKIDMELK